MCQYCDKIDRKSGSKYTVSYVCLSMSAHYREIASSYQVMACF